MCGIDLLKTAKNYNRSEQLTVDELSKGKGVYKSGEYGIKIWILADAKNSYFCNADIYSGKQNSRTEKNQGERVVRDLAKPCLNFGRTITTDIFFLFSISPNIFIRKKLRRLAL